MKIHTSCFVASSASYKDCPSDARPEVAFIGRSNVGKSSLINTLLARKQLAKVSKTPGKTQLINHFLVNNYFYLVDLPGYGWAQVGHSTKSKWSKMLRDYLVYRSCMVTTFLLIDSKIAPQEIDLVLMRWMGAHHIPFAIIFTKADKKNKMVVQQNYTAFLAILEKEWETLPPMFLVSAHNKLGIETVLTYIQSITSPHFKHLSEI